jgi:hypothetical protein
MLRPEYPGQPTTTLVIQATPQVLSTTVTTGVIANQTTLGAAIIPNFATRFLAFEQFRIVKVKAKVENFAVTNPGLGNSWFDSDAAFTPNASRTENALAKRFPFSKPSGHELSYVPHDPSEQGWSLVSNATGNIGNHYLYTDNANYGSSIVATAYALLQFELTVQFRGFV